MASRIIRAGPFRLIEWKKISKRGSSIFSHFLWNQILHRSHCIIGLDESKLWTPPQIPQTLILRISFLLLLVLLLGEVGKGMNWLPSFCLKIAFKWSLRILAFWKFSSSGSKPNANAVAKASAYTPQLWLSGCRDGLAINNVKEDLHPIRWETLFNKKLWSCLGSSETILSYNTTSALSLKPPATVTQWPGRWMSCINFFSSTLGNWLVEPHSVRNNPPYSANSVVKSVKNALMWDDRSSELCLISSISSLDKYSGRLGLSCVSGTDSCLTMFSSSSNSSSFWESILFNNGM